MVSSYNQDLVDETRRTLGIGKMQNLFTRASVSMFPRHKVANALRRGRHAYKDYSKSGLFPDFVLKFCEKIREQNASRRPNDHVVNLAARRKGIPDINTRRKPKR